MCFCRPPLHHNHVDLDKESDDDDSEEEEEDGSSGGNSDDTKVDTNKGTKNLSACVGLTLPPCEDGRDFERN